MDNLFATHPATENRIAALEKLAAEMGQSRGWSSPVPEASSRSAGPWGGADRPRGPWG